MNTNDPTTWYDIAKHPAFEGGAFDPGWYEGDVGSDLQMLRLAATEILMQYPRCKCELLILDDCTMYMTVKCNDKTCCSIFLAQSDDYRPCYFIDVEGNEEEIRVKSVKDVLDVLNECKMS